ncbi:MAG: DUF1080 domain-containing protein [Planctomycetes bacterium]|nr:DUF1080 domain-containing protein [Planctomycetota bacterium]
MRRILSFVALTFSACCAQLDPMILNQVDMQPMFPEGIGSWSIVGGKASFTYTDGVLTGDAERLERNSFLVSPREYDDFVLEAEVWIEPGTNSGIQVRSHTNDKGRFFGYQIEIDTSPRAWSGGLYDEGRRGWMNSLEGNEEARAAFKNGEWNHYRIQAEGSNVKSWVNGVPCADFTDIDPNNTDLSGFIGFQVHSGAKAKVMWRNVQITEL